MRILAIMTNSTLLIIIQQLITLWFMFDFFMARDSLTASSLWKHEPHKDHQFDKIQELAKVMATKNCPVGILDDEPSFDKVVFIVIDALGSDFIPSLKNNDRSKQVTMPFLEQSIRSHRALGYIARAATPTVTMPRIKSLLSGTIPSFVDIIYNLDSDVSKFDDDNILRISKARNRSLVFYGDDTWLSLFNKDIFTRFKETSSFFANDYTTVDTNVTEMALPETRREKIDWDYLILHYLGLDHIGHVFGSNHAPLIGEKLLEMDTVIKDIYENMAKKEHRTLMVICGDHGMSREGNHGGNSDLEAQTAMIFLPINRALSRVDQSQAPVHQIDMAATLSILTGMPVPKMSRGVAIETLLYSFLSPTGQKISCTALENLMELVNLTNPLEISSTDLYRELTNLLHEGNAGASKGDNFVKLAPSLFELSRKVQSKLLETIASNSSPVLIMIVLALVTLLSLISIRKTSIRLLLPAIAKEERFMNLLTFMIPILMHGSTDFIENEHIFWPSYSLLTTILYIGIAIRLQASLTRNLDTLKVALFFITFVITTFWNNLRLFVDGSIRSNPFIYMFAIAVLCNFIRQNSDIKPYRGQLAIFIGALVVMANHTEEPSELDTLTSVDYRIVIQRIALLFVLVHTGFNIVSDGKEQSVSLLISKLASGWISMAFLLARSHNFLFLAANIIMETSLNSIANSLKLSVITRTLLYLNFSQASFYNQGNSNLFSSIDVRPAFFAQNSYNLILSVPLVAMATFSSQIYWYLKLFQRNENNFTQRDTIISIPVTTTNKPEIPIKAVSDFVNVFKFLSLSYFMLVCLVLRNHLFVWSVLSPKLIYHHVSNIVLLITTLMISNLHLVARKSSYTKQGFKKIRE